MQNQINGQNYNGISSPAMSPQANYIGVIQQLENALAEDAQRVQLLVGQGVITQSQGQYLMAQLAKKSNEINMYKNAVPQGAEQIPYQPAPQTPVQNPLELFRQERPDFFNGDARGEVLNYIKNLDMDKDEISKIAQIVEKLENSAVDGYLRKSAHEKSLNDENLAAKSKLTSYAQRAQGNSNFDRIFTREDIGKMSGDEFTKNEKLIMDQVKQGLIK